MSKETIQQMVIDALEILILKVRKGKYGKGNNFDADTFDMDYDDEVLIIPYIYKD